MVHKTFPLLHKYSRRLAELEGLLEELEAVKRSEVVSILDRMMRHCYIKCPFLGLGASYGQFSSNGISFHHELIFAMGLEF